MQRVHWVERVQAISVAVMVVAGTVAPVVRRVVVLALVAVQTAVLGHAPLTALVHVRVVVVGNVPVAVAGGVKPRAYLVAVDVAAAPVAVLVALAINTSLAYILDKR